LLVLVLLRSLPLLPAPLLVQQQDVKVVGQGDWGERPRPVVARSIGGAAAESVSAGERHNLLVVESHAVEDVAQMLLALGGVGKAAVRRAGGDVTVDAA